ncbi:hypothetical protein KOI35_31125 [Actinoplanes bogorensis]|uniref:Lipoprotein n=1 Tax=Paractinoplanes bogorensis TaxID=1610840 RepID=A0ABS5YX64_9ACTN|nr:hypothetical protein [Actinoplanes bogorensis]MBU2667973.1 hypothetical protein [Actinoplanes bogorensis]
MRRRMILPAAVLLLAGCGSTGVTPSPPPATTTTSATASASAGESAAPAQQKAVPAESNPPGDIPDNVAFVAYTNTTGRYRFTHPEGWAERTQSGTVTFTDKLNGVQAMTGPATTAPTVSDTEKTAVPALQRTQAAFELRSVKPATVPGGSGVKIVYRRNSAPDQVTGRQYRDEVERYELVSGGREVIVELYGPVGADNVDAYRTMITSLRLL